MAKLTQFEKRKAKSSEELVKEVEVRLEELKSEPQFTQTALDIYSSNGGGSYHVAEISYNPETGEAKVLETFDITRLVALQYANTKNALGTLKRRRKGTKV